MQNLAEARAFRNGIEFYIRKKDTVIIAKRNENGEVKIDKRNNVNTIEKIKFSLRERAILFVICIVFSLLGQFTNLFENWMMLILALAWLMAFMEYFFFSEHDTTLKYHAAEHKVLNYMDKYNMVPETIEEVMKMPSISYRCGSTVVAVVLVLCTLCVLGVSFVPAIWFKILWCIVSANLTLYLWANDKLSFFQKKVIEEPSRDEVEVAFYGVREYMKEKES